MSLGLQISRALSSVYSHKSALRAAAALGVTASLYACSAPDPAVCRSTLNTVREEQPSPVWRPFDVHSWGHRTVVLERSITGDMRLADMDGNVLFETDQLDRAGASLSVSGDDLIMHGSKEQGASLEWTRFTPDGTTTEHAIDTPGPAFVADSIPQTRSSFRQDYAVHVHTEAQEPFASRIAFAGADGLGGTFVQAPSEGSVSGGSYFVGPDGVVVFLSLEQRDPDASYYPIEVVRLDTVGTEVERWSAKVPISSSLWYPSVDQTMLVVEGQDLIRLGPDGEVARFEKALPDSVNGESRVWGTLIGGDVIWLIAYDEGPDDQMTLWVRFFNNDLQELQPGQTVIWEGRGKQFDFAPIRRDGQRLAVAMPVEEWIGGPDHRYRTEVTTLACEGDHGLLGL